MMLKRRKPSWKESVLRELLNIHYHLDRLEALYKLVHHIKEDGKTGAWIEDEKQDKADLDRLIHDPERN